MKYLILTVGLAFLSFGLKSQSGYWQQSVDYKMDVRLDVENHQMTGTQKIKYTNQSPDTLKRVYFHLYFNAFQPGSMMDSRSLSIEDPDPRVGSRISQLKPDEIGYHKINKLLVNGDKVEKEIDGTLMTVDLNEPLLPGKSIELDVEFESQVPKQIRRNGRNNAEGVDYSMAQWYPKMAEYDREGWMLDPYVGREFHGVWGDFDVKITLDSSYVVGGTGYLQNPEEIGHGYSTGGKPVVRPKGKELTWHFKAPRVHDFAWAADPDYLHDEVETDFGLTLHFFYLNDSSIIDNWKKLQPATVKNFEIVNGKFGVYPYKQYSVIQGGDGGMEYPMATLISGTGKIGGLISVTVHESIHSWYYGLLATNETRYPWMDEGFTQFAQYIVLDSLYKKRALNPIYRAYNVYLSIATNPEAEPLTTHADYYHKNRHYGINSYYKGAVFLQQLSYIMGDSLFYAGMRKYYYTWRYKHPTPNDFKRVMEKTSDMDLDWYFTHFLGTTRTIDYGVDLKRGDKKTILEITNHGSIPMPVEVLLTDKEGNKTLYYIPLRAMRGTKSFDNDENVVTCKPWPWTYPSYQIELDMDFENVASIELDPTQRVADVDGSNNGFPGRQKPVYPGSIMK
ncbi:M1 family metallopeptidase [bacterium SCSIO 12741]|nr:M1 family metallopeptidase [bacterium SCSIO 12741]